MEQEIKQAEHEISNSSEAYNKVKQEHSVNKDTYATKVHEWRGVQSKIKRFEDDIKMLQKEIQRLERFHHLKFVQ